MFPGMGHLPPCWATWASVSRPSLEKNLSSFQSESTLFSYKTIMPCPVETDPAKKICPHLSYKPPSGTGRLQ